MNFWFGFTKYPDGSSKADTSQRQHEATKRREDGPAAVKNGVEDISRTFLVGGFNPSEKY